MLFKKYSNLATWEQIWSPSSVVSCLFFMRSASEKDQRVWQQRDWFIYPAKSEWKCNDNTPYRHSAITRWQTSQQQSNARSHPLPTTQQPLSSSCSQPSSSQLYGLLHVITEYGIIVGLIQANHPGSTPLTSATLKRQQLSHTEWPGLVLSVLPSVSDSQDIGVLLILFCLKPGHLCRGVEEVSSKGSVGKLIVWLVGYRHQSFLLISGGPFCRLSTPNQNFWGLSQVLSSQMYD